MTFSEFKNKWYGGRVDYDGVFAYQCVDLIKQYWHEVYGIRSGAWGDAIDYWTRPNAVMLKYFDKIAGSNAKQGDVVVLTSTYFYYDERGNKVYPGHIGIATGNLTGTNIEILEQNGSTGNGSGTGGDAIRTRYVGRSRVAGLLRRKSTKEDKMVTKQGCYMIYRFYLGRDPSAAEYAAHVGKSEFDALASSIARSNNYAQIVKSLEGANRGVKLAVINHLPGKLRG